MKVASQPSEEDDDGQQCSSCAHLRSDHDPELGYCCIEDCSCVSFEASGSDSLEKIERELEGEE